MRRRSILRAAGALAFGTVAAGAGLALRRPVPDLPQEVCGANAPRLQPVAAARLPADLSFAGTRLFKEAFLDEMAQLYPRRAGRPLVVEGGGCDDGIAAVRSRRSHVGGLCCPVRGSAADGWEHLCVGWDAKAVIAHPSLPVRGLRLAEVRAMASGRIDNWRQIGGPDLPVVVVLNDHCPDYSEPLRAQLLGARPEAWSGRALMTKTDQKQLDTMLRFELSVGINSWILAEPLVKAGRLKVLEIEGHVPYVSSGIDPRYPLLGPMNMVFREWVPELMDPFFGFLFSDAGRRVVARRMLPTSAEVAGLQRVRRASRAQGA